MGSTIADMQKHIHKKIFFQKSNYCSLLHLQTIKLSTSNLCFETEFIELDELYKTISLKNEKKLFLKWKKILLKDMKSSIDYFELNGHFFITQSGISKILKFHNFKFEINRKVVKIFS